MERGGLIKKTSLMQLFFKDKIYTLNSNHYWFSVHFQVLYESLFNRITSSLQDLQSLRARLSYCTYDTFCLADFHLTTRFLHLPHLRTFRLPNSRRTCSQFIPSSRFGQTTDLWIYRSTFEKIQYRENMGD